MSRPEKTTEKPGNDDIRLSQTTTKTFLVPRMVCPRWDTFVDQMGGVFDGELQLGNGTQLNCTCAFTQQRHLVVAIHGQGSWRFPHGSKADYEQIMDVLSFKSEEDAKNLSDFINSQLDGGLEENDHVGSYQRRFCA